VSEHVANGTRTPWPAHRLAAMASPLDPPLDQPFDENDEIVGVTVVREDLRLLLVVARIFQMDEEQQGRSDPRLQLAMDRVGATASSAEWQPKKGD
jgi:hypothetical protein